MGDSRHELVELEPDSTIPKAWMIRCSCGWKSYFVTGARLATDHFLNHLDEAAEARYTLAQMEAEWCAGQTEGYELGFDEGREEGWVEGRADLIEELTKLKEAIDA